MKKQTSRTACSRSRSDGTTQSTTPRGIACAADATHNAFAGAVRPDTLRVAASIPVRAIASFRRARTLREVVVGTDNISVYQDEARNGGLE